MPKNKNAMTRYKILDELLSDRYHCYSLDDLTEIVNNRLAEMGIEPVVRRSIEKDIHYLEYDSEFLVDIERYTANGEEAYNREKQKEVIKHCLRYADSSFSIFKKKLTNDEQHLLRELLTIVGHFDGLPNLRGLQNLQLQLHVQGSKAIISLSKNPLEGSNIFGELYSSISHKSVIKLTYHTFALPDEKKTIIVSPYLLKEYNRRWFLLASAEEDNKLLTFGLERIDAVQILPTVKYNEWNSDLQERFEDIIGVTYYSDRPIEHIIFWVSDELKHYIMTKPLHESQRVYRNEKDQIFRESYPTLPSGAFFSIDVVPNYEMYRELMSYGKELLVLEPIVIRDTILQKLAENLHEYKNMRT